MNETWEQIQYPSHAFLPEGNPSDWFNPAWMAAIDQANSQMSPVLPIPYVYTLPSFFYVNEPSLQVNPVYYEAWQNQATTLMPIYSSEELEGARHLWPYMTMQIARPVFLPDGTGVTSPTKADPVNTGRDDLELAPL